MRQMAWLGAYNLQQISAPFGPQMNLQLNQFATPLLMNEVGPHRGIIISTGIVVATSNFSTLPGALDVQIQYAIDGASTPTSIPLYQWNGVYNVWSQQARSMAMDIEGEGYNQGDRLTIWMGISFRFAGVVIINCNAAPDSGTPRRAHLACLWARARDVM